MKKAMIFTGLMILVLLLFSGCHPGNERYSLDAPAGFWWGIWHGVIAFFTLIGSLFSDNVTIYESANTGFWYNLGFLFGVGFFSSGGVFSIGKISIRYGK